MGLAQAGDQQDLQLGETRLVDTVPAHPAQLDVQAFIDDMAGHERGDDGDGSFTVAARAAMIGGFCVLDVPSHDQALRWAARIAAGCRCAQEVRRIMDDAG